MAISEKRNSDDVRKRPSEKTRLEAIAGEQRAQQLIASIHQMSEQA